MTPYTVRRDRRRTFLLKVGVYLAIVVGLIAQAVVKSVEPETLTIEVDLSGWSILRVGVALFFALVVYWNLDGKHGEMNGKIRKASTVWRALTLGFTSGYTLMSIAGIGE